MVARQVFHQISSVITLFFMTTGTIFSLTTVPYSQNHHFVAPPNSIRIVKWLRFVAVAGIGSTPPPPSFRISKRSNDYLPFLSLSLGLSSFCMAKGPCLSLQDMGNGAIRIYCLLTNTLFFYVSVRTQADAGNVAYKIPSHADFLIAYRSVPSTIN